jgi:hypothetical protein
MGSKPKAPKTPNYAALAKQQAALDKASTEAATMANRATQVNPWATQSWERTGGGTNADPYRWTQNTTLAPDLQRAAEAQMGIQGDMSELAQQLSGRVGTAMQDPFDISGAPEAGKSGFGAVQEIQDAMMSRLQPDMDRRRQQREAQMVAQGVGGNTGSEAWDRQQALIGRDENDANQQALLGAMGAYGDIFDRQNVARNQYISEQQMLREQPLNEMLSVLRGQEVKLPGFNDFYAQGDPGGAKVAAAGQQQYGAEMDKYNAASANRSSQMGALGTLGGAGIGAIFGGTGGAKLGASLGSSAGSLFSK